jgi:hypothetical protein
VRRVILRSEATKNLKVDKVFFEKNKIKLFPSVKRLNEDFNERGTHPPSPSLGKRRGEYKVPLFVREGFRACPELVSGVTSLLQVSLFNLK